MEPTEVIQADPLMSFLPLLIITIPLIFICRQLAKEKGKKVGLWTVLGIIPLVNYFAVIYLIGAANAQLEQKIDLLLSRIKAHGPPEE